MATGTMLPPVVAELVAKLSSFEAELGRAPGVMRKTAQAVEKEAEEAGSNIESRLSGAAKKVSAAMPAMASVGKAALLGIGGAAIAGGAMAVKMAGDFEESMTQLVTGAGESEANLKTVSDGILAMAPKVGETTQQLAAGMYLIESAGYKGANGLSVLKAAAQGAKTGNADLATVANAVTTALQNYHLPASDATEVTSALVQTVADGKTHMEDLANSLGNVMPNAAALGITFQDVTGAMASLTLGGTSARRASMNLNTTLLSMSAPGATAKKAMADVGLSAQQLKNTLASQGLSAALQLIEDHVGKHFPRSSVQYTTALKDIMGGTAQYSTLLKLSGSHAAAYEANVKNIGGALHGSGKEVQGFGMVQKDLNFQMDQAKATVETLGIKLGTALIPILRQVALDVEHVVVWFEKHKTIAEALGIAVGTVLVTAIAAYVVSMASAAAATIAATAPILAIIAAVAAVGVGIAMLATHWHQVWTDIKHWLDDAWHFIDGILHNKFVQIILAPIAPLLVLALHWHTVFETMKTVVMDVKNAVETAIRTMIDVILSAVSHLLELASHLPFVGGKFKAAAKEVDKFKGSMDSALGGPPKEVKVDHKKAMANLTEAAAKGVDTGKKLNAVKATIKINGDASGFSAALANVSAQAAAAKATLSAPLPSAPSIPHMAGGGLVNTPTLALIGEAGPEVVLPVGDLPGGADALSGDIGPAPDFSGSGGASGGTSAPGLVDAINKTNDLLAAILKADTTTADGVQKLPAAFASATKGAISEYDRALGTHIAGGVA